MAYIEVNDIVRNVTPRGESFRDAVCDGPNEITGSCANLGVAPSPKRGVGRTTAGALLDVATIGLLAVCTSGAAGAQSVSACGGVPLSRWSQGGVAYSATSRFGDKGDNWLGSLNGLATNTRGDVFLHDGKSGRILVLDEKLNVRRSIGRPGQGPGELTKLLADEGIGGANTLAATDSTLYLANMSRIISYDLSGGFLRNLPGPRDVFPIPLFKVRALHAGPLGLLVGYWHQDYKSGAAALQTLLLEPATPALKHELPLLRSSGEGRMSAGPRHPRPLWGAYNNCVVVGNGSSNKLVRVNLATGRTDTLALPEHTVPPFEVSAQTKRNEKAMRAQGFDVSFGARPAELWRYAQLQVDPDGHVWVNPWFAKGAAPSPLTVYRIDPAGRVHLERIPAFPVAFGPAGVYYTRGVNPDTDEIVVIRYARGR